MNGLSDGLLIFEWSPTDRAVVSWINFAVMTALKGDNKIRYDETNLET